MCQECCVEDAGGGFGALRGISRTTELDDRAAQGGPPPALGDRELDLSSLPVPPDPPAYERGQEALADNLRDWLDEKLQALRDEAEEDGSPFPLKLPVDESLFSVPRNLIKSLNLDSPYGERRRTFRKRIDVAAPWTSVPCRSTGSRP